MTAREPSLAGRTALVTGAARRLGRATALALADNGADVVIHYRGSADEAGDVAEQVRRIGRRAWCVQADLADPAAAGELVGRARDAAGTVDVLVNNASIFPADTVTDFTPAALDENVRVNALAPLLLCRAFADGGNAGHVVNFLDSRFVDYDRAHAAYHLSKRMLASLTRMLALELAPAVQVNAVAPGLILPPPGEDESFLEANAHTNPLNRYGSPAEIADAVLLLVRTRFITGQVIFVDGGRHMKGRVYD